MKKYKTKFEKRGGLKGELEALLHEVKILGESSVILRHYREVYGAEVVNQTLGQLIKEGKVTDLYPLETTAEPENIYYLYLKRR